MVDYGKLIQMFLEVMITVLLPIILRQVFVWLGARIEEAKASKHSQELAFAESLIRQMVLAAEQSGLAAELVNIGVEKKKYVIGLAEAELARKGINIDLDVLDAMIEAQVMAEFNKFKGTPVQTPDAA